MFKHGDRVRLKNCPPDREPVGKVTGWPRAGSLMTAVTWPDGWGGWELLENLEPEVPSPKFDREALDAARAAWIPQVAVLANASLTVDDVEVTRKNVFHGRDRWRVQKPRS